MIRRHGGFPHHSFCFKARGAEDSIKFGLGKGTTPNPSISRQEEGFSLASASSYKGTIPKKKNCLDFKLRRSTACLSIHRDTSVLTCFQHLPFSTAPIPLFAQNLLPCHFKLAYKEPQQNSWNVKHFFFWRGGGEQLLRKREN